MFYHGKQPIFASYESCYPYCIFSIFWMFFLCEDSKLYTHILVSGRINISGKGIFLDFFFSAAIMQISTYDVKRSYGFCS